MPEQQVQTVLQAPSAFADSMYETMDWAQFAQWTVANQTIDVKQIDLGLMNAAIFYATNKYRASLHLPQLKFSPQLRNAAVYHSLQMVNQHFFSHNNPTDRKLRTPQDRIPYFGFQTLKANGENIATEFLLKNIPNKLFMSENTPNGIRYFYADNKTLLPETYVSYAEKLMKDWINSPPHRKNLQEKLYTQLGCGAIFDTHSGTLKIMPQAFATQDFGG